ncbi:MAG TPA: hypothetical protein VNX88_20290 [Terriglobales bacterium]|nr:hypothetical protein [Terriglobales bacterium]
MRQTVSAQIQPTAFQMTYLEFLQELSQHPVVYLVLLVVTVWAYLFLLRKRIYSISDPLFFAALYSALAATAVWYMCWRNLIETTYVLQFAATEVAFIFGILVFPCFNGQGSASTSVYRNNKPFFSLLYIVSSGMFVIAQIAVYSIRGIPIFYASRLQYYAEGGGLGIFDRILSVSSFFCWYLIIYRFAYRIKIKFWPRLLDHAVLWALVFSAVLSGSKSTFLTVVFVIFYFRLLHRQDPDCAIEFRDELAKWQKRIIIAACFAFVSVMAFEVHSSSYTLLVIETSQRLSAFGDTFFMAFPTHLVESLSGKHPLLAIFGGVLVMFRLVSPADLPENVGFQLYRGVYGFDAFVGPNPRHNLMGLVYFGIVGSIFYSLTLGLLVGFLRNVVIRWMKPGNTIEPLFAFLAVSCVSVSTDIAIFMKDVSSALMVVPVMYLLAFILDLALAQPVALRPNAATFLP